MINYDKEQTSVLDMRMLNLMCLNYSQAQIAEGLQTSGAAVSRRMTTINRRWNGKIFHTDKEDDGRLIPTGLARKISKLFRKFDEGFQDIQQEEIRCNRMYGFEREISPCSSIKTKVSTKDYADYLDDLSGGDRSDH